MHESVQDRVAANLAELGLPAPTNIIQTMLMKARYFVGWKLRYDSGCAVLQAGANTIEIYDDQGSLLKTVAIEAGKAA